MMRGKGEKAGGTKGVEKNDDREGKVGEKKV